ncbi:mandelate racemase [Brachybacterium sp. NBEC-018]|uniref:mandelate racemase/muconate lactonizing enzyme family protein n=1 Tax=Brachybacterium sp. NBEC-018 TaxID=2996004 RepID=UPI002175425A|nr:enolase C-terminal domain-like protein [Brachybacterium sp. NBEC-018]UVY84009.1 mandelate racemase [Brachybacterium sp. NBEC-018]
MSGLAGHRVTAIEPLTLRSRYTRSIGRNARLGAHGDGPEARGWLVRTDTGLVGWGMDERAPSEPSSLVGRPLEELIDPATGVVEPAALGLDVALHDLAARALELPLHVLLSGGGSAVAPTVPAVPAVPAAPAVPCYSGAIYFDDLDPDGAPRGLDAVLESCAADHAAGHRAFKLKLGRGNRWMEAEAGYARDLEVVRAVRAAHPSAHLLVDMNDGYSVERTLRFLEDTAELDLFWIEEPFAEERSGLTRLRARRRELGAGVLVADGEFDPDVEAVLDLAAAGLVDVLLMDVLSFGVTAWRALLPRVRELGVQASPHAWGHPLKTLYAAQLAAASDVVPVVEGVPGTTDGVDDSGYTLRDGAIRLPRAPGLGLELTSARPS